MDLSRHNFLGGVLAVTASAALPANVSAATVPTPDPKPIPPRTGSDASVTISVVGDATAYAWPAGPLPTNYAIFQRANGDLTFWRGNTSLSVEPPMLGAHHVTIKDKGGKVLFDKDIAGHGWYQQWTFRAAPLVVTQSPAQIIAANRSFKFGDIGLPIGAIRTPVFAGPFDNANLVKGMNAGGGGSDRWVLTDYSAHFMRTGDAAGMLAQAQAADSVPINYVDHTTGKPIDLITHPLMNTFTPQGQPYFVPNSTTFADGGWSPATDHFPSVTYHAWQATHNVSFLYNLQHAANFEICSHAYWSSIFGKAVVDRDQVRNIAWGLRCLFEAHVATTDAEAIGPLPADLQPSSYFKALLDNNLEFYTGYSKQAGMQRFRTLGPQEADACWQDDYLHTTLAFGVLTGHTDWVPLFLWKIGNLISRLNGTSGWPPGLPAPSYLWTCANGDLSQPQFTWAQAFDAQVGLPGINISQADHDAILAHLLSLTPLQDRSYLQGCYAAATMIDCIDKKGLAAVRATYSDFDTCLTRIKGYLAQHGQVEERFSVVA